MPARGFTLTELVIILVLVGVMAVFVLPRLNVTGFQQEIFADEVLNAVRHARKVALYAGCPVRVTAAGNRVSAVYTGDGGCAAAPLPHPSRGGDLVLDGTITSGATVEFDARGRSGGGTITTASGDVIIIEPGSGYVHR
ncbi:MAG: prepilin-type cleavage/methylation domain-containing protein [Wenzhouxiangellaceae bacterium]|nr:prepilin-type cleavage/methylation domain-containing protein [Wenzhouxiangellaceae bacterium]